MLTSSRCTNTHRVVPKWCKVRNICNNKNHVMCVGQFSKVCIVYVSQVSKILMTCISCTPSMACTGTSKYVPLYFQNELTYIWRCLHTFAHNTARMPASVTKPSPNWLAWNMYCKKIVCPTPSRLPMVPWYSPLTAIKQQDSILWLADIFVPRLLAYVTCYQAMHSVKTLDMDRSTNP